jgi:hypothetical protein
VRLFLDEPSLFALEISAGGLLLPESLPFCPCAFLFVFHLRQIIGGEFNLVEAQVVILLAHANVHGFAEPRDAVGRFAEPVFRCFDRVRPYSANAVVGFRVVGAEQQPASDVGASATRA